MCCFAQQVEELRAVVESLEAKVAVASSEAATPTASPESVSL